MAIVDIDSAVEMARDKAVDDFFDGPDTISVPDYMKFPVDWRDKMAAYAVQQPLGLIDAIMPDSDMEASEPYSIIMCLMKHKQDTPMWETHAKALARYFIHRTRQSLESYEANNGPLL